MSRRLAFLLLVLALCLPLLPAGPSLAQDGDTPSPPTAAFWPSPPLQPEGD